MVVFLGHEKNFVFEVKSYKDKQGKMNQVSHERGIHWIVFELQYDIWNIEYVYKQQSPKHVVFVLEYQNAD